MKKYILFFGIINILFASCNPNHTTTNQSEIASETKGRPKKPKLKGKPRILFIGNSHIEYFVSTPLLFDELCKANNQPMNIDKLVEMGGSIDEIYRKNKVKADHNFAKTDPDGNYYDYAVIQEKTPIALADLETYKASVKMMVYKIQKNSPDVAIYIYEGMAPIPFESREYYDYYATIRSNAMTVLKMTPNAGLFRMGDAIKDAYEGKSGYKYLIDNIDRLRLKQKSLHVLNDGGFMQGVLLYATIFDKKPIIPAQLSLSTGTGKHDGITKQEVSKAISNPKALEEIAFNNR